LEAEGSAWRTGCAAAVAVEVSVGEARAGVVVVTHLPLEQTVCVQWPLVHLVEATDAPDAADALTVV
jgi:hypothetical protein